MGWNSIGFEIVKRLHAGQAFVECFACGRAKVRGLRGVVRAATRAGHAVQVKLRGKLHHRGAGAATRRWRNAEVAQFLTRHVAHPIGCPCGRELGHNLTFGAQVAHRSHDVVVNLLHRRAAAVSGRDGDGDKWWRVGSSITKLHIAQNAHFMQADHRNFWVAQGTERLPNGVACEVHHTPSGCARAKLCISPKT